MPELIQQGFVLALVVQQHAGSRAGNQEVSTEGHAGDIGWGPWWGHLKSGLAFFLARVYYRMDCDPACMQIQQLPMLHAQ